MLSFNVIFNQIFKEYLDNSIIYTCVPVVSRAMGSHLTQDIPALYLKLLAIMLAFKLYLRSRSV